MPFEVFLRIDRMDVALLRHTGETLYDHLESAALRHIYFNWSSHIIIAVFVRMVPHKYPNEGELAAQTPSIPYATGPFKRKR